MISKQPISTLSRPHDARSSRHIVSYPLVFGIIGRVRDMRHALCKPAAYFVRILLRRLRLILSLRYNPHTTVLFIGLLCAVD